MSRKKENGGRRRRQRRVDKKGPTACDGGSSHCTKCPFATEKHRVPDRRQMSPGASGDAPPSLPLRSASWRLLRSAGGARRRSTPHPQTALPTRRPPSPPAERSVTYGAHCSRVLGAVTMVAVLFLIRAGPRFVRVMPVGGRGAAVVTGVVGGRGRPVSQC